MSSRFVFRGFGDESLEKEASQRLSRLMDGAPYDATSAALLEKIDSGYSASVDIYSTHGPFMARAVAPTAKEALDKVLVKIGQRLESWRLRRFNFAADVGVA